MPFVLSVAASQHTNTLTCQPSRYGPGEAHRPFPHIRLIDILWLHATGTQCRDTTERYGSWRSLASQFYRWVHAGV